MEKNTALLLLALAFSVQTVVCEDLLNDAVCEGNKLEESLAGIKIACGTKIDYDDNFAEGKPYHTKVPDIKYPDANPNKKYTIVMADPDAPSHENPSCRSWLHYILANIKSLRLTSKGRDLAAGELTGSTLTEYNPPSPPADSGYHRYFLYLFEQSGELEGISGPNKRCKFDVQNWKDVHNLRFIKANMFETKQE